MSSSNSNSNTTTEGSTKAGANGATNATTPSTATTANPSAPDPSGALKVAIVFVKQYYKCLSSRPDMLERFYNASSSYLSHGEGSEPTELSLLDNNGTTATGHDRWGCQSGEKMLFEFEDGAIDAQPSQNEGILMVVTASVIFTSSKTKIERRKTFVQTFFLAKIGRNFAVTNDILRFLVEKTPVESGSETELLAKGSVEESSTAATTISSATQTTSEGSPETKEAATYTESTTLGSSEPPVAAKEGPNAEKVEPSNERAEEESSAPGGGVEESKEEAPEEDEAAAAALASSKGTNNKKRSNSKETKGKNNKTKGGGSKQQQQQQQQPAAASKPAPGSWASLVVSGGSAPNTPSRPQERKANNGSKTNATTSIKQPPLPSSDKDGSDAKGNGEDSQKKGSEKDKSTASTSTPNAGSPKPTTKSDNNNNKSSNQPTNKGGKDNNNKNERTKRDPDNTLVIKNLSENIKEHDILSMFQPFATQTKTKIVGTNLNHHRLLAFVDYDSVAPVMAALKKHKETPFEWNGKVLEVDQKTMEQKARRNKAMNNNNNSSHTNGYRTNNNNAGAGRGGNPKYNNNGRGDGGAGRRRGTRPGR